MRPYGLGPLGAGVPAPAAVPFDAAATPAAGVKPYPSPDINPTASEAAQPPAGPKSYIGAAVPVPGGAAARPYNPRIAALAPAPAISANLNPTTNPTPSPRITPHLWWLDGASPAAPGPASGKWWTPADPKHTPSPTPAPTTAQWWTPKGPPAPPASASAAADRTAPPMQAVPPPARPAALPQTQPPALPQPLPANLQPKVAAPAPAEKLAGPNPDLSRVSTPARLYAKAPAPLALAQREAAAVASELLAQLPTDASPEHVSKVCRLAPSNLT